MVYQERIHGTYIHTPMKEEKKKVKKERNTKLKKKKEKNEKANKMRSGRRPSPEGPRIMLAGTITPMICPVYGPTGGRPRQKTRQENKRKRAETYRAKTRSAFLCPADGPRRTQKTQRKAETKGHTKQ